MLDGLTPEEAQAAEEVWALTAPLTDATPAWVEECAGPMRAYLREQGALPLARIHVLRRLGIKEVKQWHGFAAIAACVLVLLAVGITVNSSSIDAPYGEYLTHTLPDGSTMTMNSGTKVRLTGDFDEKQREVRLLRGEVFFEVVPSDVPFVVETDHGTVDVLGTAFDVRYWPSDAESSTDVAVKSGRVRVTPHLGRPVVLTAGDAIRLLPGSESALALRDGEAENQLSWTQESFKYSNHHTTDIIEEIERRFDIDIQVESEELEDTRSGILLERPENPEQILNDLCELHACTYSVSPDGRVFRVTLEE